MATSVVVVVPSGGQEMNHEQPTLILEPRKALAEVHNTLPRNSKSEDDLLGKKNLLVTKPHQSPKEGCNGQVPNPNDSYCSLSCAYPVEKVQKAGYQPLVNESGSTTSEDTLRNVNQAKH